MFCEVIIRSQDCCDYRSFLLPLQVVDAEEWNATHEENRHGYVLSMMYDCIGEFKEKKHALHVMNYLLAKRNYYVYDAPEKFKSVILNVPTDEVVRQTPDENLFDGFPIKEKEETETND